VAFEQKRSQAPDNIHSFRGVI
jgi:hypothetical protein